MSENYTYRPYSLDAYIIRPGERKHKWTIILEGSAFRGEAIAASKRYVAEKLPPSTHFHVWQNGDCIFDSHEGQSEPENEL